MYSANKIFCGTEPVEKIGPEQRLWRAVLGQVLDDAFGNSFESSLEKKLARSYLKKSDSDYQMVCEWAGLSPEYVKRIVRKKITKEFMNKIHG